MASMRFLSVMGNSLGCSASGERLVSAARDGDFLEAKALLEYNPRLARYSTFGVRNSPLHYSAAQGHHEIVSLLIESGVDINLRNYRGQTALMQACQYGRWEVVQILILFKANIHRADCLNGATALHFASLNGHPRCIRLLLADYIPSVANPCITPGERSKNNESDPILGRSSLFEVVNRTADGGVTALHMAALNGYAETVHLLLDLGASVSCKTLEDGTNIDLVGAGSTPLHYAACGGNAQCCLLLIAKGAILTTENAKGWTPLIVARSWHRDGLEGILSPNSGDRQNIGSSPYICLPLGSIILIARECGWRSDDSGYSCSDPCVVCLERKCSVAAEGCSHEFCTQCALYLCSTSTTTRVANGPPGSVACPLCRQGIVCFIKLPGANPAVKEMARSRSVSCCSSWYETREVASTEQMPLCTSNPGCHGLPAVKLCLRPSNVHAAASDEPGGCSGIRLRRLRSGHRRSNSQEDGRNWLCSFSQSIED